MELQERRRAVLRHARRRAALHVALREGDVLTASRAWERLRVRGAAVSPREAAAAHDARARLGRAIREARERRSRPDRTRGPATTMGPLATAAPRSRARPALSLLVAGLIVVLAVPTLGDGDAGAAAGVDLVAAGSTRFTAPSRGRTLATPPPDAATLIERPAPAASAAPAQTETPAAPTAGPSLAVAAHAATAGAAAVPASSPPLPTGAPAGVAGATGTGAGTGTGASRAAPSPKVMALQPPALPSGVDRFLFEVLDSRSQRPLEDVCVIYGTLTCTNDDPHTNLLGLYWLDIPVRTSSTWAFTFAKSGYVTATVNRIYRPGQGTLVTTIALRRR